MQPLNVTRRHFPPLLALLLCGCTAQKDRVSPITITGPTMGTRYTVKLAELPQTLSRQELQAEIDAALESVNDQMSTWRPDSELSRFNRFDGSEWFEVSPETAKVVAEAVRISALSHGAFDCTVGPLVNLWNFGPGPDRGRIPSEAEIAEAKATVGSENIKVRRSPPALRKTRPELSIDLSAIAKGFAVDRIAKLIDSRGVSGFMVEIGGEIRTQGHKADGAGWSVGIETPTEGRRSIQKVLVLGDRAMATSGDYRNFFEIGPKRYSHTIDPRTGRPVAHALASVSVVAQSCMFADATATALMVLGPENGYDWAVEQELAALLIVRNQSGFVEKATPAFQRLSDANANSKMSLFLAALVVFAIAMAGMAAGIILSNRRLRGTCGGLAGFHEKQGPMTCDACETPSEAKPGDANSLSRPACGALQESPPADRQVEG